MNITLIQCGYVRNMSTIDAIPTLCLLAEKYRERRRTIHAAFLNLKIEFSRVSHELSGGLRMLALKMNCE